MQKRSKSKNKNKWKKSKISDETDFGKELLDLWEKSNLKHLSLTSVGIAIGVN